MSTVGSPARLIRPSDRDIRLSTLPTFHEHAQTGARVSLSPTGSVALLWPLSSEATVLPPPFQSLQFAAPPPARRPESHSSGCKEEEDIRQLAGAPWGGRRSSGLFPCLCILRWHREVRCGAATAVGSSLARRRRPGAIWGWRLGRCWSPCADATPIPIPIPACGLMLPANASLRAAAIDAGVLRMIMWQLQAVRSASLIPSSALLALYQLLHNKCSIKCLWDGSIILSCWVGCCSRKHGLSNCLSLFSLRHELASRRWNKLASWCMLTLLHTTDFQTHRKIMVDHKILNLVMKPYYVLLSNPKLPTITYLSIIISNAGTSYREN